jgi:outer membrane protein
MKKIITGLCLAGMLIAPVAYAEKIGFVNEGMLFNEYAKAKGVEKTMEAKFDGPKKELEKRVVDIKALEKEIKTNELLMTESKLTSSKEKLKKMIMEYRQKGAQLENEFKEMRNKEMSEFRKIVFEVIKKYAAEKKYDLILNEGVMFAADKVNITDDISSRVKKLIKK